MSIETRIRTLQNSQGLQSLLVEEIGFEPQDTAAFFDAGSELQAVYSRPAVIAAMHGFTERVQFILDNPASPDVPRLEAEIDELVFDLYSLTASERSCVLAARGGPCEDEINPENDDESQTASTTRSAVAPVAG